MKKIMAGLSVTIALLTVGSVILPALVTVADAGWFGLINLTPTISTVSPTGVKSGGPDFTLTVTGANFVGNSVVKWNGNDRTTTFVNAGRLTATILAADIAAPGTASVTAFNPAPGGGTSSPVTVTINTKTNTMTTIVSDLPDPSPKGLTVTVVYSVTAASGTPTGTVVVTDSASPATCSGTVAAGSCTLAITVVGTRTLTATYSGDANFNDSSAIAPHVVFGPDYLPWMSRGPTLTPTITPTPTPIPTIANPIRDSGFESGGSWLSAKCVYPCNNSWEGWDTRSGSGELSNYGASPHTGSYAAFLGGLYETEMRMDEENVTVPAGGSTLRYWIWIRSDETTCDMGQLDGAWVSFNGNLVDSYALCTGNATSGWVKRDVSLGAYAGQTGTITFYGRIWGAMSYWFIDDVQMGTLSGDKFVPYRR